MWGLFTQQFCGWLEDQLPRHETSAAPWVPQYPYLEISATLTFEPEWMGEGQEILQYTCSVRRHCALFVSSFHQVSHLNPEPSKLGVQGPQFPFKPELGFKRRKETK